MGDFNVNALKLIRRKETNLSPKADHNQYKYNVDHRGFSWTPYPPNF